MAKVFTNLGEAASHSLESGETVFTTKHRGKEFFAVAGSLEDAKAELIDSIFELDVGVVQTGVVLKAYSDHQKNGGIAAPEIPEAPPKKSKKAKAEESSEA